MATKRMGVRALALALLAGVAAENTAQAQLRVEDVLGRKPVQPGVAVSTPSPEETATCRVEQVVWPQGSNGIAPKGIKLIDGQGRMLRQFIDTNGGTNFNIASYYLNGVEAYREIDSNSSGRPDQYRWLGANGGKWGSDPNKDGTIDTWYVLSPEELSQELFQSMLTKDRRRMETLLVNDDDLKKMGLPAADAEKIKRRTTTAVEKMLQTADSLKLGEKSRWIHLELGLPFTTPADAFGGREDLVRHKNAAILVDKGDNKAEIFQTGELLQVGRVWKLVDGPAIGAPSINDDGEAVAAVPKQIEPIIKQLTEIKTPTRPEETYNYHLSRAQLLEEAVAKTSGIEQVPWLKQLIDAYTAAVESNPTSDKVALPRLKAWKEQIMITPGATETQAYVSIRFAAAEYASNLANAKSDTEFRKLHNNWREQLDTFVKTFPKAAEAPEALMRLAVAYEFDGREGDAGAKAAYERLVRDYPSHMLAPKAAGAIKRLGSEGQPFQFSGTTLDGKAFSEAVLAGKTAIVYFWASWANGSTAELKALAELEKAHSAKGVVIVTVSLDDDAASAINSIREAQLPGYHLHAAGGLDRSPLANAYGVQMVPHIMLVNKEGKVASRGAQNGEGLKAELDKLIK